MRGRIFLMLALVLSFIAVSMPLSTPKAFAKEPVGEEFRIGVLGVFSGGAAAWGLATKYAAITGAEMINEKGGFLIGGVRHPIKLFIEDTKFDVKVTRAAVEKLVHRDKVKYILGPNTTPTCGATQVVTEPTKVVHVGYGFTKTLWTADKRYAIMGMTTPEQSCPVLYKELMDRYNAKTMSMVVKNYAGGLNARKVAVTIAESLGYKIINATETYEPETTDFFPVMSKLVKDNPDVIDISSGPGDMAGCIKAARQLGYKGLLCCMTGGDINTFNEIAGKYADGFVCIGGPSLPALRTKHLEETIKRYAKVAGEWTDTAATNLYALDMVLETIRTAGPAALKDTDAFLEAMPRVRYKDPYIKGNPIVKYVGKKTYGHNHQIGVPMVFLQVKDRKFQLFKMATLQED